ncbi:hypothetical protein SLEP1_g7523 [Rubroshorea leprosula]|uniref:Uncharacterized protein n=1 Tax=Rubroshorea leprosula TaxID=152421 RepID=A0AAV5I700_9ROSI|nr:hypothetical protein SLEP1_g7523 [Rubroshorea leprosula]
MNLNPFMPHLCLETENTSNTQRSFGHREVQGTGLGNYLVLSYGFLINCNTQ